jgi:hypothetical protein
MTSSTTTPGSAKRRRPRSPGSAAINEDSVRAYAKAFEDAGCDELTLFPTSTDPQQVDLLADAIGL